MIQEDELIRDDSLRQVLIIYRFAYSFEQIKIICLKRLRNMNDTKIQEFAKRNVKSFIALSCLS